MKHSWQTLRGWLYRHDWQLAGVLGIAIAIAAAFALWPRPAALGHAVAGTISNADIEAAQEQTVIVYISGAVQRPGLYPMLASLRVSDAIVAAGGLADNADPNCLPNLAAHVKDAKQITVPIMGGCSRSKKTKLDINTATWEELLLVPGMDAALADAIISYREDYGYFVALTELETGMGLDANTYKQLAKSLTVD